LWDTTGKWEPCGHLAETLHHGDDSDTGDGVTEEDRDGTGIGEGSTNTKEQTSSNGTTECDELDMTRLQAATKLA
jgi:hypothetical protein